MTLVITDAGLTLSDKQIFQHINLTVERGEFLSIIGPSGCGKSSLLNVLAGSLLLTEGEASVDGQVISGYNGHFAYMPQEDLLFDWKTVFENITLYQTIHHLPIDNDEVMRYLDIFGLTDAADAYPEELSGGMKQRTALLRTLLVEREFLLLDEPFGALDIITRNGLQDWLKTIKDQLNRTIILVTHDIDEALYLSDRIVLMGGSPSHFISEIDLAGQNQTREWLNYQGELRNNIYTTMLAGHQKASERR
ncbi:ABC transporter ATP-binding protein [Vagococcus acidifermentans]|uniref:ABC transporter ATP-binding protein n=1 Tax=Vagococcus acidifermentans TaxID=564710 RepID=A0A430AXQ0_9ENTE|nr:ABC transporter ATP-binding protein [Vagococcus acidifermentans]RSU12842.1 ABC transporter ATP-binding protein [Vagococcus acidifermentans]